MTEREKIIEALKRSENEWHKTKFDPIAYATFSHIAYIQLADALLAANIGDMTAWKERAEKAEKERDEYRKSTHIALRGIEILKRNTLRYFATEFPSILQQAERELAEEGKDG